MKPKVGNVVKIDGALAVVYSDYGTGLNVVYFDGSAGLVLDHDATNIEIIDENLKEFFANDLADLSVTIVLLEEQLFKAITGGDIDIDKCNELLKDYAKREGLV